MCADGNLAGLPKFGDCHLLFFQFRSDKDFTMQHAQTEDMEEIENDLLSKIMEWAPVEKRLCGLSAAEILRVLPEEEFVAGLTEEQTARLRELLDRKLGR